MYTRIMVGTDGSTEAQRAADHAANLATTCGAELLVACVAVEHGAPASPWSAEPADHPIPLELAEERAEKEAARLHAEFGITPRSLVLQGHAATALQSSAVDLECSLLVVGERGISDSGVPRLGSVAEELAHLPHIPLLIVP